jgi:hypothetical protein
MLNAAFTSSWVVGAWLAALTLIVAASTAMGAKLSTTAVLFALGIAPAVVIALLAHSQPAPSVAEILRSRDVKDRRS